MSFHFIQTKNLKEHKCYNTFLTGQSIQNINNGQATSAKINAGESPEDIRNFLSQIPLPSPLQGDITGIEVGNIVVQGTRIKYFIPSSAQSNKVIIYFHGGGFVWGSPESYENICKLLAKKCGAKVLSVDYKLAPEYKFPIAIHESVQLCDYILTNGIQEKVDIKNNDEFIFCGDSAGGNLVAIMTHELIEKYKNIIAQVLIYPMTLAIGETLSCYKYQEGFLLTKKMMEWFENHYIGKQFDKKNPQYCPYYYNNFQKLPKTLIICAQCDPLRDEGFLYAKKCEDNGVPVSYYEFQGLIHGFFRLVDLYPEAYEACDLIGEFLNR